MLNKKNDVIFKNYLKTKLNTEVLILRDSKPTEPISVECVQSSEFIMGVIETLIKCGFLNSASLNEVSSLLQLCISHQISRSDLKQKVAIIIDHLSNVTPDPDSFIIDTNSKYINSKDYKKGVCYVHRVYVKAYL